MFLIAQQSPIKSFADLQASTTPINFAAAGVGSASYVETIIMLNGLKLPIKPLTGYNGNDDQLAMRRGEIVGSIGSRSTYEDFVRNGYGRMIVQIGGRNTDVPQLIPQLTDPKAKTLAALIQSQGDIARLTAGPANIPADRLAALRDAYKKALEDKELQAKAEKLERPVEPAYGDEVLNAVKAALNQTPETIAMLKQALQTGRR